MENRCNHCGATFTGTYATCPSCGKPLNAERGKSKINVYGFAAAVLALLLFVLSLITALMDSSTFINRMYTTALEWNIPLVAIAATVVGFVVAQKEGKSALLSLAATGLLAVGFVFSNTTKNRVQDHISNLDNYVGVASEAVRDNASSVVGWLEMMEESVEEVEKGVTKDLERYAQRKEKERMKEIMKEASMKKSDVTAEAVDMAGECCAIPTLTSSVDALVKKAVKALRNEDYETLEALYSEYEKLSREDQKKFDAEIEKAMEEWY